MKRKILIVDTSLACVWLKVPEMEVAGSDDNSWDYDRVNDKINGELEGGALLVLPLASIIETGNHITHIKRGDRTTFVSNFTDVILKTINGDEPWATYSQQSHLWEGNHLRTVVSNWCRFNETGKHSLGDITILDVATAYRDAGFEVEILTADDLLKSYQDVDLNESSLQPRRRRYK